MGLRPTYGNEKHLGPAPALCGPVTLSLSSRPERSGAEGSAVLFLTGLDRGDHGFLFGNLIEEILAGLYMLVDQSRRGMRQPLRG